MDNREGNQPESIKPTTSGKIPSPAETNGVPFKPTAGGTPVATAVEDAPEEERFFSPGNLVMIAIVLGVLGFIYYKVDLEGMWNVGKAAIGLSFVIFIHELGHFLAAKWCGVNVTTFSIGFGPAIPGCKFTWGETTYKLAILPLGGYVQMVGQVDGEEASDGSDDDPRSYRRKAVWQRMLIISAGVIMNAILAVACFIYVYEGPGKKHPAGVINSVDSDSPAYRQAVRSGGELVKIGDIDNPNFTDMIQTVIVSMKGDKIPITFQRPGHEPVAIEIEPRKNGADTKPVIGMTAPPALRFIPNHGGKHGPFSDGTPAAKANFEYGDVIVAMTDPANPTQVKELPVDPRASKDPGDPSFGQRDYFEFARRLQLLAGQKIVVVRCRARQTGDQEAGRCRSRADVSSRSGRAHADGPRARGAQRLACRQTGGRR